MERLKRKKDWIGRKVRLLHDVETKSGVIFPAGTVMQVVRNRAGLHLHYVEACQQCRVKFRHSIHGVMEASVALLPKDW